MIDSKLINWCEQGTDEWLNARLGVITASEFSSLITPKTMQRSSSATPYLAKLAAEQITGCGEDTFSTKHTKRGHELEPTAVFDFEMITDLECYQVGMIYKDENRQIACSPDSLVDENGVVGGLEVKCLMKKFHAVYLLENKLPDEHFAQVQGSMWVTGAQFWYFTSYHPEMRQLIIRCEPDLAYHKLLDEMMPGFLDEIDFIAEKIK